MRRKRDALRSRRRCASSSSRIGAKKPSTGLIEEGGNAHERLNRRGSGFLGQHLLAHLTPEYKVSATYCHRVLHHAEDVQLWQVDFEMGAGLETCLTETRPLDVIVHCAALSSTGTCEENKEKATKINVPTLLLEELAKIYPRNDRQPLFVHLSSDQVYDGGSSFYGEDDLCRPVNHYGTTKVQAEECIKSMWDNYVILRSSLIYGSQPTQKSEEPKFLDFMVENIKSGKKTKFFSDEYRCPIFVLDIVKIVEYFMEESRKGSLQLTLNMGGPQRLSRVDMARQVALHLGIENPEIDETKSVDIVRKVRSPLDISMDCRALMARIPFPLTPFSEALEQIFPK